MNDFVKLAQDELKELRGQISKLNKENSKLWKDQQQTTEWSQNILALVAQMYRAIDTFCEREHLGHRRWKNQPHIKALFDIHMRKEHGGDEMQLLPDKEL